MINTLPTISLLVVENDPSFGEMIEHWLTIHSFITYHVKTLRDALKSIKINNIDVLLLDLCLPNAEELETLKLIVNDYPHIPIIVLTGDSEISAVEVARIGAESFISRSLLTREILIASIENAHAKRSRIQELMLKLSILEKRLKISGD